jgi:predicted nucleic acid-binding protein
VDETIYLYLDASALVKRYIAEVGSEQVRGWITSADKVVTGLITRVEVAAANARAQRMKIIIRDKSKLSSSAGSAR